MTFRTINSGANANLRAHRSKPFESRITWNSFDQHDLPVGARAEAAGTPQEKSSHTSTHKVELHTGRATL